MRPDEDLQQMPMQHEGRILTAFISNNKPKETENAERMKERLREAIENERCDHRCPECKKQCVGIKGHFGEHQCPIHYKSFIPRFCPRCGSNQITNGFGFFYCQQCQFCFKVTLANEEKARFVKKTKEEEIDFNYPAVLSGENLQDETP